MERLATELASANERLLAAEAAEARARSECLDLASQSREAREKYERGSVEHAILEKSLACIEEELAGARKSWNDQRRQLELDAADKGHRCAELEKQVDSMQQLIATLSFRMAVATRVQEISVRSDTSVTEAFNTSLNASVGGDEPRTVDQLLELVRFLRREKEMAISRFEDVEFELHRLKTELERSGAHSVIEIPRPSAGYRGDWRTPLSPIFLTNKTIDVRAHYFAPVLPHYSSNG